jgi:hypothetical protein
VSHLIHPDTESTVVVHTLDEVISHLSPQFGPEGLATRRSVDAAEVTEAFQALEKAKRRVRVYSTAGFVPNSYRYRCEIQYVEAEKTGDDNWVWSVRWGSAQRKNARAATVVVQ